MNKTHKQTVWGGMLVLLAILLGLGGCASTPRSADQTGPISERIYYVSEDGSEAMVYTTSRTDYSDYDLWFRSKKGYKPEDYLKDFLYMFPTSGEWRTESGFAVMKLPLGSFASLEWANLEQNERLRKDADGVFSYSNWDGQTKTPDGHYGLWNSPDNFERIACSWVFPENLEPVLYESNREGEWVRRHNTITYYGNNVNDLAFNIQYRPSSSGAYKDLKGLEGEGVEVEQTPTGVRVTLAETLLFPTGSAEVSSKGKETFTRLASTLRQRPSLQITVAGHTDNVPIGPKLAKRYPTNWELSSARSINVIHYLMVQGVAQHRFESHAFSYMRPLASNDPAEGRRKNRRTEIFLEEKD
jgi:flagellar motor protein MotB